MKKITHIAFILSFVVAIGLVFGGTVHAQMSTMPVLYNQNGSAVNTGTGTLGAGYYYLGGSPAQGGHQVYYYGNGTYYDATTHTYGGSVSNSNGTAGASLYSATDASASTAVPGVPNTGAGGGSTGNWVVLILAGAAFLGSMAYIVGRAIA